MRLSEKDKKFVAMWREKRTAKIQFYLGLILQITLITLTYKLAVSYFTKEYFDIYDFMVYGIFGILLGAVIAFLKYRSNEKRYKQLTSKG